jgi:ribosome-binding ATPase
MAKPAAVLDDVACELNQVGVERDRINRPHHLDLGLDLLLLGDPVHQIVETLHEGIKHAAIDMAHIDRKLGATIDGGWNTRVNPPYANCRKRFKRQAEFTDCNRHASCAHRWIASQRDRRGTGMTRLPLELHQAAFHSQDAVEGGKADARCFKERPLLDVKLCARHQLRANITSSQNRFELNTMRAYDFIQPSTVVVFQVSNLVDLQSAAYGSRPEQASTKAGTLLIGPVDHADRDRQPHAVTMQRTENLCAGQHAEATVKPSPIRDGVEVATEHDALGAIARQGHPQVAGRIDVGLDGNALERASEPLAAFDPVIGPGKSAAPERWPGVDLATHSLGDAVDRNRRQAAKLKKVVNNTARISRHAPVWRANRPDVNPPADANPMRRGPRHEFGWAAAGGPVACRPRMERFGFVGLPNAGKSSLFNALAGGGALAAPYPFATKEPNVGRARVPDHRLDKLAAFSKTKSIVHAVGEFVDIGGLVEGAHKGEGLGNKFLANIREVDAIVFVARAFEDGDVPGSPNPLDHLATVEIELALADLATIENQLPKRQKAAKLDKSMAVGIEAMEKARTFLANATPLYRAALTADDRADLKPFFLLTNKPVLVVVNVGDGDLDNLDAKTAPVVELMDGKADVLGMCVQLEAEAAQLEAEERQEMLDGFNLGEGALPRVMRSAYHLLGRRVFFTTGEKETRAWTFPAGAKAPQCAGEIHSDIERGFIRAETIHWDTLLECGSFAKAKEKGLLRLEGKDYEVLDGDVMDFRFNV